MKIYDVNLFVCRSHFKTGHISTNPEDPDFFPNQNLPLGTSTVKISKKSPTIVEKSAKTDINTQQVEPKSIPRKKTPPKIIKPFFNDFKQVKTILKFLGYVSLAVLEISTFKKLNFEQKSKVKV